MKSTKPAIAKEEHFAQLDRQYRGILCGHDVNVSSAPSSKFLGEFLDEFPELTIEQGRAVVSFWISIMNSRPRVMAAQAEIVKDPV